MNTTYYTCSRVSPRAHNLQLRTLSLVLVGLYIVFYFSYHESINLNNLLNWTYGSTRDQEEEWSALVSDLHCT